MSRGMIRGGMWAAVGVGGLVAIAAGCRPSGAPPAARSGAERVRALPAASGSATVAKPNGFRSVIRVHPDVYAAYGVRWRPWGGGPPYLGENEPWKWTDVEQTAAAAGDLRDLLTRMLCGADADLTQDPVTYAYTAPGIAACGIDIAIWDGASPAPDDDSILVGRPADFDIDSSFDPLTRFNREAFVTRGVGVTNTVYVLGNEGAGVRQGVISLARQWGYRYFLPMPAWEIVPDPAGYLWLPSAYDVSGGPSRPDHPGFLTRRLALGVVGNDYRYDFQQWRSMNGFDGAFQATGVQGQWNQIHAEDPTWYDDARATSGIGHANPKFCPDHEAGGVTLAEKIKADWSDERLEEDDPSAFTTTGVLRDVVGLSPGDGGRWQGCADNRSPADRMVKLANDVGGGLGVGDKYLNVLAYRETYPGPTEELIDTNLYVWLAGDGWKGLDDEAAFDTWHDDMQGDPAGREPTEFGHYIYWNPDFNELPNNDEWAHAPTPSAARLVEKLDRGFIGLWIESAGGWGPNGVFKYLLMDIARDPSLAQTAGPQAAIDALRDDFRTHAFPPGARDAIRDYFDLLDTSHQRFLLSADVIDRMYEALGGALTEVDLAGDDAARARVEDLLMYARHVDLFWRWRTSALQADYEAFIEHAVCADERRIVDYDWPWAAGDPMSKAAQDAYELAHSGDSPREVYAAGGFLCTAPPPTPIPDYDSWIANAPTSELTANGITPYLAPEGPYGRATAHPGAPGAGKYEANLRSIPRDSLLWKVWLDPVGGMTISDLCGGTQDQGSTNPEAHTTSRMLGVPSVTLEDPSTGEALCRIDLPPHREAFDVHLSPGAAAVSDDDVSSSSCFTTPRLLPFDTAAADTGIVASCEPTFASEGVYDLRTHNHRKGLDYYELTGTDLGVSRWESPIGPFLDRRPVMSNWNRYFYVPHNVDEVAIWAEKGCFLEREGCADIPLVGAPGYRIIDTVDPDPACGDKRGQIWGLRACRDAYLINVPPVVAPLRDQLLVSCDFVNDPAQATDLANLAPVGCP